MSGHAPDQHPPAPLPIAIDDGREIANFVAEAAGQVGFDAISTTSAADA